MRVAFWSLVSLGLLSGMILSLLLAIAYVGGFVSLPFMFAGTIIFAFFSWLLGPLIMQFTQGFFFKLRRVDLEELAQHSPASAEIINQICAKYKFKTPKLFMVEDQTPTAYTYGSGRFNARIVVSEGLFHYLDDAEAAAVVAHEMGHITRRDFIVMTIASVLIQLLYQLTVVLRRSKGSGNSKGKSLMLYAAIVASIFHFIAQYVILFLSRVREYGADEFAARETGNPNALSTALIKIAYGINQQVQQGNNRLASNAGALNIYDHKVSRGVGNVFHQDDDMTDENFTLPGKDDLFKVMLFDKVSYWARLLEFKSTHPLTGKRLAALSSLAKEMGQEPFLGLSELETYKSQVDFGKLRSNFCTDIFMSVIGYFVLIGGVIATYLAKDLAYFGYALAGFFVAQIFYLKYRFPSFSERPTTTVLEAMQNIYASPIKGMPVKLSGIVIGKGQAGARFSEDAMLQDKTGLIFLNFQGLIPLFSNLHMAFSKFKKILGYQATTTGWFFRSIVQRVDIKHLDSAAPEIKPIKSHPYTLQLTMLLIISIGIAGLTFYLQPKIAQTNTEFFNQIESQLEGKSSEAEPMSAPAELEPVETAPVRVRPR